MERAGWVVGSGTIARAGADAKHVLMLVSSTKAMAYLERRLVVVALLLELLRLESLRPRLVAQVDGQHRDRGGAR